MIGSWLEYDRQDRDRSDHDQGGADLSNGEAVRQRQRQRTSVVHRFAVTGMRPIGSEHGYDRRGLGGFFTGARAPLRRVGDRVRLSAHGEALLDEYLARAHE